MNPALLLVLFFSGSALFVAGVLAWLLGWLPPLAAGVVAAVGAVVEAAAAFAFLRSRQVARRERDRR